MEMQACRDMQVAGEMVRGFNEGNWELQNKEVAMLGCWAKFVGDERLRSLLLGTGERYVFFFLAFSWVGVLRLGERLT